MVYSSVLKPAAATAPDVPVPMGVDEIEPPATPKRGRDDTDDDDDAAGFQKGSRRPIEREEEDHDAEL